MSQSRPVRRGTTAPVVFPKPNYIAANTTTRTMILGILALLLVAPGQAPPAMAQDGSVGAIRGTVYDLDFGVPLARVRVSIAEALLTTQTSEDGNFVFEQLPPGSYTVTFLKNGYERETVRGVVVSAGRMTDMGRLEMGIEVIEMPEMIVTGEDLLADSEIGMLEIRAESVTLQDSISSELIGKAGVSDVAGALKLVVGATVVEGKYATVRGLSDRYTGTTLNGIRIPSADPRRRAVQVDQFPTGTIDSVTVTKTFTPDLQGDFTGGGVDIVTKSIPDGPLLKFIIGTESNSLATGNDRFLTYRGGGADPYDIGGRGLPAEATEMLPALPPATAFPTPQQMEDAEAYDRFTRAFTPVIGVSQSAPGMNTGFSLLAGNRFSVGREGVLGVIGALTYTNKYDFYEGGQNNSAVVTGPDSPIEVLKPREDNQGTEEVLVGMLGNLVYQANPDHELSMQIVLNDSASDDARIQFQDTGAESVEQNQTLHYTDRTVRSLQFRGNHTVTERGANLRWTFAKNYTEQDEPDLRFFRNTFDLTTLSADMPANSTDAQNTRRIWRNVEEDNNQFKFDAAVPFDAGSAGPAELKVGLFFEQSHRDYVQRSYTYTFPFQFGNIFFNPAVAENFFKSQFQAESETDLWTDTFLDEDSIGLATNRCVFPENVFVNPCAAPNQLLWVAVPLGDDVNYVGDGEIDALYAMADVPVAERWRIIGGARFETTELRIDPYNELFGTVEIIEVLPSGDRAIVTVPQEEARASISESDILPSIGVVYDVAPAMKLRASWSRTIARPTYRELAPVATEEFIFGDEFMGNPELTLSRVTNYDVRWEWFRRPGEVLAASMFFKDLVDPIEFISFSTNNRSFVQPVNFEHGTLRGFELEARSSLDLLGPAWKHWSVGGNLTVLDTEVEVPESEQESLAAFGLDEATRRLQGQPEFIFNVNVTYDNTRQGVSAGLFYNLVGETLLTGAARGVEDGNPNVFETSFGILDFNIKKEFGPHVSLRLRARNLLGDDKSSVYRIPNGDEAVKKLRETPTRIGVSLSYQW